MLGFLTFILIFGILVVIHEFGHFYFAKKAGILVREFAVGMGPKIFSHIGQDGTLYTIRILPLGGYVRMAGWGEDKTEIRTGSPASLSFNADGLVSRINLSNKRVAKDALPINITSYDLEDALEISGQVGEETKMFAVDHNATIVEADGTEVRIAPLDVQYQNASVWGRMLTNFAGPMNNFILGLVTFVVLVFVQGGMRSYDINTFSVTDGGALAQAGLSGQVEITAINGHAVTDWESLTQAVELATSELKTGDSIALTVNGKSLDLVPTEADGRYYVGITPGLKTGFVDKILGGVSMTWEAAFAIFNAFKSLIFNPDIKQLGGPIAVYQLSSSAAKEGLTSVLSLMGFLSMNLGIFNLIPIPALDGGKILLNIIEAIRRKPLKQETETYITLVGVAIMLFLMIAVTWNDIVRTFF